MQSEALSPQILAALTNHPWPGNIRQLVNVIRVAVAIADGEDLQIWHLPADFLAQLDPTATGNLSDAVNAAIGVSRSEATFGRLKKPRQNPFLTHCRSIKNAWATFPAQRESYQSAATHFISACGNLVCANAHTKFIIASLRAYAPPESNPRTVDRDLLSTSPVQSGDHSAITQRVRPANRIHPLSNPPNKLRPKR